jgi:hypothetical protein
MSTISKAIVAALVVLCAALAGVTSAGAGAEPVSPTAAAEGKRAKSRALTAAPAITFRSAGASHRPADARAASEPVALGIPLPDGGNFNGVQWERADGLITDADLHHVLQFNAACQWYRALRDGREVDVARQAVGDIPRWSTFRDSDRGEHAARIARDGGDALRAAVLECDASHQREVSYARELGRPPSA